MNMSRLLLATATATSVLAAIGCTSTRSAPEVATAPMTVPAAPPEQVAAADAMPSHPALQNERTAELAPSDAPIVVAKEPFVAAPISGFTERAPQADRN